MNIFKKLFGKKEFTQEKYDQDYELKLAGLERVLGKKHDLVGHAIIPFDVGGAVDMYYFPNGIKGTGFATMELIQPDGKGPKANKNETFELLAFTKLDFVDGVDGNIETNPFNKIERRCCGILTTIGNYSFQAKLKPKDTCEVPVNDKEPNRCVVFDEYKPDGKEFYIGERKHMLLLVIEVFREEMEFARENGTGELLAKLKDKGFYPYSDLDREPVI